MESAQEQVTSLNKKLFDLEVDNTKLNLDLSVLSKEKTSLSSENDLLREQLNSQQKLMEPIKERSTSLEDSLEVLKQVNADLEAGVRKLQTNNAALSARERSLTEQMNTLRDEISEINAALKAEQNQVTSQRGELSLARTALANAMSEVERLKGVEDDNKALELRISDAEKNFQLKLSELKTVSADALSKVMSGSGEDVKRNRDLYKEQIDSLTNAHEQEMKSLREDHAKAIEGQLQNSKRTITELTDKIAALEAPILDDKLRLAELQSSLALYRAENLALQQSMELGGKENQANLEQLLEQKTNMERAEKSAKTLALDFKKLEREKASLVEDVSTLTHENEELRAKNLSLTSRVSELDEEVTRLSRESSDAKRDVDKARQKLLNTETELKKANDNVEHLQTEIGKVRDDYANRYRELVDQKDEHEKVVGADRATKVTEIEAMHNENLHHLQSRLDTSIAQVAVLATQLRESAEALEKKEEIVDSLNQTNKKLQDQNSKLSAELRQSEEKNKDNDRALKEQASALLDAQNKVREINELNDANLAVNEQQKTELAAVQLSYQALAAENPELQLKWSTAQAELATLTREVVTLRAKQSVSEKDESELAQKVVVLTRRIELIMDELRLKEIENQFATEQLGRTGLKLERAIQEVADYRGELAINKHEHASIVKNLRHEIAIAEKKDVASLHQQLVEENQSYQLSVKELRAQIADSVTQMKKLEKDVSNQATVLEERQRTIMGLNKDVEQASRDNAALQIALDTANKGHKAENTALREQLETQKQSTKTAQKMLGQLRVSLEHALNNHAKWRLSARSLSARNKNLKQKVSHLHQKTKSLRGTLIEKKHKVQDLEQALLTQTGELEKRLVDVSSTMEQERLKVTAVTEKLADTTAALERARAEAQLLRDGATEHHHQYEEDVQRLQKAMKPLQEDQTTNQAEITRLQDELSQVTREHDADKMALREKLRDSIKTITKLEPLIEEQKRKITHQQTAIGILEYRILEIQSGNTQLQAQVAQSDTKNASVLERLKTQSETSVQQIETLKAKLEESFSKNALLEKNMESILRDNEAAIRENATLGFVILGLTEDVRILTAQLGAKGEEVAQSRVKIESVRQELESSKAKERKARDRVDESYEDYEKLIINLADDLIEAYKEQYEEQLKDKGDSKQEIVRLMAKIREQSEQLTNAIDPLQHEQLIKKLEEELMKVYEEKLTDEGRNKQEVASLKEQIREQSAHHAKAIEQLQQIQQQVDAESERLVLQSAELESRLASVAQLTERCSNYSEQNAQLRRELAESKDMQKVERDKFEKQLHGHQIEVRAVEASLAILRASHATTVNENKHLVADMVEWKRERAESAAKVSDLTAQVQQLKVDFAIASTQLGVKENDVIRLQTKLNDALPRLDKVTAAAMQLNEDMSALELGHTQEIGALQAKLLIAERDKESTAAQIEALKALRVELTQAHAIATSALREQLDGARLRENTLKDEAIQYKRDLDENQSEVAIITQQIESMKVENQQLRQALEAGGGVDNRNLIRQLDQQNMDIRELSNENHKLILDVVQIKKAQAESSLQRLDQALEYRESKINKAIMRVKSLSAVELSDKHATHLKKFQQNELEFRECIKVSAGSGIDEDVVAQVANRIRHCRELLGQLESVIAHQVSVERAALAVPPAAPGVRPAAPAVPAAGPGVPAAGPAVPAAGPAVPAAAPAVPPAAPAVPPAAPAVPPAAPAVPPAAPAVPPAGPAVPPLDEPPAVAVEAGPPKPGKKYPPIPLTIFGDLDDKGIDRTKLFTPPVKVGDKPVIAIKYTVNELNDPDLKERIKEHGLKVTTPSGQHYNLCIKEGVPKAVMSQSEARKEGAEDQDQYQQRLAVSIMNMIDNVLPYSDSVNIKTENPFIAEIARQYIEYLKDKPGLRNVSLNLQISNKPLDPQIQLAADIFNRIKPAVERNLEQQEPDDEEAKAINFRHLKHKLQSVRESGASPGPEDEEGSVLSGRPPDK